MTQGSAPGATVRSAIAAGGPVPERRPPPVLIDAIAERLRLWPQGVLVSCDESGRFQEASYEQLWRRSLAIAAGLEAQGIGAGRILALAVRSALDFTAAAWAGLRLGCTLLPLSGRAAQGRGEALAQVLAAVSEAVVLAEAGARAGEVAGRLGLTHFPLEDLERAGADAAEVPPRAVRGPACLLPTSGSTGRVKLAALPEAVLIRRQLQRQPPAPDAADCRLLAFDADSITGMSVLFLGASRQVLVSPSAAAGRPALLAEAVEAHRVTLMVLTCSLAGLMAEAVNRSPPGQDLSSLRQVNFGAEAVDAAVAARLTDALARFGAQEVPIVAAYGSTETGNLAAGARIARPAIGAAVGPLSHGPPSRGVTVRIVGEDGAVLDEGEVGAIEALAPGFLFSGYWGEDSATAAAFSPDGWYRTGDLGALNDGQLSLHGRVKEMIISRGAKHALADIDSALQAALRDTLPARADERVLSFSQRRPGEASEQLAAVMFSAAPLSAAETTALEPALRSAAARRFGLGLKAIAYAPAGRLPLGPNGKVMRRELAMLLPSLTAAGPEALDEGVVEARGWLEILWRQVLASAGPVLPDSDFFALGGDSLASAQLFAALETRLERRIAPDAFFARPTFANLEALVGAWSAAEPGAESHPAGLPERLQVRMEAWPGSRPTRDRLLAGLNLSGSKPPLYWVFQGGEEFAALAEALGPGQPLCGFRSGHLVFRYSQDNVEEIARRYVDDLLEAHPEGPFSLGGNCQGGILALAMAGRLAELGRAPELLVLMEWTFRLRPYAGPVLFLHGVATQAPPGPTAAQLPGGFQTRPIPGAHGGFFWRGNVEGLAALLSEHLTAAA